MLEHLKPNGLDDLKIAGGDDGKGDNETKHVDVEDVGNVHGVVLPSPHPLDPTAAISWVIQSSSVFLPHYLTPRVFWLKVPNPNIGGKDTKNEYVQMKVSVRRVDLMVERGNCLSLVTIMHLCRASTDRLTMDWIPGRKATA